MKIKKNVELPKAQKGSPKFNDLFEQILEFIKNDDEFSMDIECESLKEGRNVYSSLYYRCKSNKLPVKVWSRGTDVYITKVGA